MVLQEISLDDVHVNTLDTIVHDSVKEIVEQDDKFVQMYPNLTLGDRLVMAIQLRGLTPVDNRNIIGKTLLMIFEDPYSDDSFFHTTTASNLLGHNSPFNLTIEGQETGSQALIKYDYNGISFQMNSYLHGSYGPAYDHYFPHITNTGQELPFNLTINPYHTCAEGCSGCSRKGTFSASSRDYVDKHIASVQQTYDSRYPGYEWENIKWIAIITGCQPTPQQDVAMFLDITSAYRKAGGVNAEFCVFTSHINSMDEMGRLAEAGIKSYVRTIECINDNDRRKVWGKKKGLVTFNQHLELLDQAKRFFPMNEVTLVLGTDSFEEMMQGIKQLDQVGAAIAAYVPRIYNSEQLNSLHPDVSQMGMHYFYQAFDKILEANTRNLAQTIYLRSFLNDDLRKVGITSDEKEIVPRRYRTTSVAFERSEMARKLIRQKMTTFQYA